MTIAFLAPISSTVALVRSAEGTWHLTDGFRFSRAWPTADEALADAASLSALEYGSSMEPARLP